MKKPLNIRRAVVSDFNSGDKVEYIDFDGAADPGTVSSIGEKYVFVRFDKQVKKLGWDGATSQACDPNNLHLIHRRITNGMEAE